MSASRESRALRRLFFVIPPYFNAADYLDEDRAAVPLAFTMPYGILSMEAYLTENSARLDEFGFLDLNVCLKRLVSERSVMDYEPAFQEELRAALEEFQPDVVGVSALFNSSFGYIQSLVHTVKEFDPEVLTLAGGGLPSAAFELMLTKCPDLDAICKGEGELPLLALLDADDPQQVLTDHRSWIDRSGLQGGKQPAHTFIDDLDDIPPMNYDTLDLDHYNSRGIDKRYVDQVDRREMAIHTSRGCPFLCVFCSNPSLHGRAVRFMSVDRVIQDGSCVWAPLSIKVPLGHGQPRKGRYSPC